MLSCSLSLLKFAHRQPAGSANSHSRRQTRQTAAFAGGRTSVKAGLHSGCSDPRSKLALGTTNHLYSVAAITNTSGQVVERYSYNAYGVRTVKNPANVTIAKSAVNSDRGFTSYKLDGETGLYFARARMYSCKAGRFIGRDTETYVDGYNLYSAVFVPMHLDWSGRSISEDYNPSTDAGNPWSDGNLGGPQPNGDVMIGVTRHRMEFTAQCVKCTEEGCDKYEIKAVMHYRNSIVLDVSEINRHRGHTVDGTYGHEQQHVRVALAFVKAVKTEYESKTNEKYIDIIECVKAKNPLVEEVNKKLEAWINRPDSQRHAPAPGQPPAGTDVPPNGAVPAPTPNLPPKEK